MNVLIQVGYGYPTGFWLELAQRHVDAGDAVTLMECDAELPLCSGNWQHTRDMCDKCIRSRRHAIGLLGPRVERTSYWHLTDADRAELSRLPVRFDSLAELMAFGVENYDVGMGVASTLMDITGSSNPDVGRHADVVRHMVAAGVALFRSTGAVIRDRAIGRVYVWNGRYYYTRAARRASERAEVPFTIFEGGVTWNHLVLYENTTPHTLRTYAARVRKVWDEAVSRPDRAELAHTWYAARFGGRVFGDSVQAKSFVRDQAPDVLPPGFDPTVQNIGIFNSSDNELASVQDEWPALLFSNQQDGLRAVADAISRLRTPTHAYLRIHPNMRASPDLQRLYALRGPRLTVVDPDSSVSTYALVRACDKVITFGSTVGIEAAYLDKPSILLSASAYEEVGSTYNPTSIAELDQLLDAPLLPKGQEGALMYGYYMATLGTQMTNVTGTQGSGAVGLFRGRPFGPGRLARAVWAAVRRTPLMGFLNASHRKRTLARLYHGQMDD